MERETRQKPGYGLIVRFTLRPGAAEAFDRLVADTIEHIREKEPGTLVYVSHSLRGEPGQRVFYELYESREAFETHEAQPHVARFLAERAQYLAGYTVDFVTPVAMKGVPQATT